MSLADRRVERKKASTRQFIGIEAIRQNSIRTARGVLAVFLVKPTNIAVLSAANIAARIDALATVLKNFPELELLCLNSREDFEGNKRYLQARAEAETVPEIRALLVKDIAYLDKIQAQMATAREFAVVVRLVDEPEAKKGRASKNTLFLARLDKVLKDQSFTVKLATGQDIMRILAVYFEQNVTTERFEAVDGERFQNLGEGENQ